IEAITNNLPDGSRERQHVTFPRPNECGFGSSSIARGRRKKCAPGNRSRVRSSCQLCCRWSRIVTRDEPRIGLWSRWVRFLDRRESGTSLALFRIARGLSLIGSVLAVVLAGVVPLLWLAPAAGGSTLPPLPWHSRV